MSYHVICPSNPGLNILQGNPCNLLSFDLLKLNKNESYQSKSDSREILAVLLGGKATFHIDGNLFENVGARTNVFGGKPHSIYIPRGVEYSIEADEAVEIAMPSAPSELRLKPYLITPCQVVNGVWGAANFKRYFHQILTSASQPDLPANRLIVGETYTPSGNWSTYPPHKHEVDDLPHEAFHEEIYYFKLNPRNGFGLAHYYNEAGEDENYTILDNSVLRMPFGYHTIVSAPGYTTYYLWCLAGTYRVQAITEDPNLEWVGRTVSMLKEVELKCL
jgi:5-deoxy-glucuronate isomerase